MIVANLPIINVGVDFGDARAAARPIVVRFPLLAFNPCPDREQHRYWALLLSASATLKRRQLSRASPASSRTTCPARALSLNRYNWRGKNSSGLGAQGWSSASRRSTLTNSPQQSHWQARRASHMHTSPT